MLMATTCPVGFDVARLRATVLATYERVARDPDGDFHFHRGARYAAEYLRYDAQELALLPSSSTARFAGVGNPLRMGPIDEGETVLDHACGGGMDVLLAARRVGPEGRVIGVDMTPGMREVARSAARHAGLQGIVDIREGLLEQLPVADGSVDVVISNGVLNLSPDKPQVFREIHRVLRPGGRLYLADVVVQRELRDDVRNNPDLWAACIAGALPEPELAQLALATGFVDASIGERFDCFRDTAAAAKVSGDLRVHAVNFLARKPVREPAS
jgi:arsenite methyltransferase